MTVSEWKTRGEILKSLNMDEKELERICDFAYDMQDKITVQKKELETKKHELQK